MRELLFRIFLLFVPILSFSQQGKQGIDLNKLSKLYAAKEKKDIINLQQIAKQKGWALILKDDNQNAVAWLTSIDSKGFPVYTTINNNIIEQLDIKTAFLCTRE